MKKTYYAQRRQEFIDMLGGKCVKCGSTKNLEFDHVDPTSKKFNVSKYWSHPTTFLLEELSKCQLLCSECHKDKTGRAKHGTISMYKHHKCRCDDCRLVWNLQTRKWKNSKLF